MVLQEEIPGPTQKQSVLQKFTTSLDRQGRFAKSHVAKEKRSKNKFSSLNDQEAAREAVDHGRQSHEKEKSKLSKKRKLSEEDDTKVDEILADRYGKKKHKKSKKEREPADEGHDKYESKVDSVTEQTTTNQGNVEEASANIDQSASRKREKRRPKLRSLSSPKYDSPAATVTEELVGTVVENGVNNNGLANSQDTNLQITLNEFQGVTQLDSKTIRNLDTSHIPESMRERLLRTVKSMSGPRAAVSYGNIGKEERKRSKKKKLLPTIEANDSNITNMVPSEVIEANKITKVSPIARKRMQEGVGEAIWVKKKYNAPPILLFNSGTERSPAPSPEVSPATSTFIDTKRDLMNAKSQSTLPPRTNSLAKSHDLANKDADIVQESEKKHKPILPPTRVLKNDTPTSPAPILPPVKSYATSATKITNTQYTKSLGKKRPLYGTDGNNSGEAACSKSSKRRKKISFQGSPLTPNEKKVMLTDQDEWEVTIGKFRGSVNLSTDKDEDAEITESKVLIYFCCPSTTHCHIRLLITDNISRYCLLFSLHSRPSQTNQSWKGRLLNHQYSKGEAN